MSFVFLYDLFRTEIVLKPLRDIRHRLYVADGLEPNNDHDLMDMLFNCWF